MPEPFRFAADERFIRYFDIANELPRVITDALDEKIDAADWYLLLEDEFPSHYMHYSLFNDVDDDFLVFRKYGFDWVELMSGMSGLIAQLLKLSSPV